MYGHTLNSLDISASGSRIVSKMVRTTINGQDSHGYFRAYEDNGNNYAQIGGDIYPYHNTHGLSIKISGDGSTIAYTTYNFNTMLTARYNGSSWVSLPSININGTDYIGIGLSYDGNILAIGEPCADEAGTDSGRTRIFQHNGNWVLKGQINGSDSGIKSGTSVSLSSDGNTIAIGEPYADEAGADSGRTRIIQYNNFNFNINNLIKEILLNIPTINISNLL